MYERKEDLDVLVPEIEVDEDFIEPSSWAKITKLIKGAPEAIESEGSDPEPLF